MITNNWSLPVFDVIELCPMCGCETEVLSDGKSDCEHCGHKEVLPCSVCPRVNTANEDITCDWNYETRCSEFPVKERTVYLEEVKQ